MFDPAAIEVSWTLVVGSGLYPTVMNVWNQYREWKALKELKVNHGAQLVSAGYLAVETIVMILLLSFISVGIISMFVDEAPGSDDRDVLEFFIIWMLFFGGFLISTRCWLVYFIRFKHTRTETTNLENPRAEG